MPDLAALIQHGASNPWLYLPVALVLGALHALEPGHSKSLMAAFIIAIRGTPRQAVLLGISAAIGHTIIVWGLAVAGLWLGDKLILDKAEPWLILISGVLIVLLAVRLLSSIHGGITDHSHAHGHAHDHPHDHDHLRGHGHHHDHGQSSHDCNSDGDAHAAAHARDIEQRFAGRRNVTSAEIAWFGFTGGLLPCPAAIAVLLVCLQLKAFTLGVAMVAAFSIGLAITLVGVGLIAAWGTQQASLRFDGYEAWSRKLPYISGALVLLVGLVIFAKGFMAVVAA